MLVPYLGETGAWLVALGVVVLSLIAFGRFILWVNRPYRDLVDEIKKRPRICLIHLPNGTYVAEMPRPTSWPAGDTDG